MRINNAQRKRYSTGIAKTGEDELATFTDRNGPVIEQFRAHSGKVEGRSSPLFLLTTKGAKSGRQRVSPLAYRQGNAVLYVFASKAGAPSHPDCYHNLVANSHVTVEIGAETYRATAMPLEPEDRDRIWGEQAAEHPNFTNYQKKTSRLIPVVAITIHN